MPPNNTYAPGFIGVEDAIRLIHEDKRDDAKVDLQFLVSNIPYMKVKQNYNIRLMKTVNGKAIRDGSVYVTLHTEYDRQVLLRAIQDAYQARTGIKFNADEIGINHVNAMVDQEKGISEPRPRAEAEGRTKVGDNISNPYTQVINGE